jgi:hypothetical protein
MILTFLTFVENINDEDEEEAVQAQTPPTMKFNESKNKERKNNERNNHP